ncbi:MAG: hypothetical protein OER86_08155 [Phycisphaerae bacterium]|nr:hypothetical protein [Phycisphaerae bacterium]
MNRRRIKLFTYRHLLYFVPAVALGVGVHLWQVQRQRGAIQSGDWIAAALAIVFCGVVFAALVWWGNRPADGPGDA